ncbi:MAG: DUF6150 family protein [Bacteroidia bacterium]
MLFISVLLALLSPTAPAPAADICELQGPVFIETVAGFADYKVFVEEFEYHAALNVYRESNPAFANEAGHWYFTDIRSEAAFSVFFEKVPGFADFSIYYTDFPTAAGCK